MATRHAKRDLRFLQRSVAIADSLIDLADRACVDCADEGCLIVYGIVRDCGYRIRASAEQQLVRGASGHPGAAAPTGRVG